MAQRPPGDALRLIDANEDRPFSAHGGYLWRGFAEEAADLFVSRHNGH